MITDHLPALEYVLRDKAARGEKIKAALLLIDVDSFGKLPRYQRQHRQLSSSRTERRASGAILVALSDGVPVPHVARDRRASPARRRSGRKRTEVFATRSAPAGDGRVRLSARWSRGAAGRAARSNDVPSARLLVEHAAQPRRAPRPGGALCRALPRERHQAHGRDNADARRRRVSATIRPIFATSWSG